MADYQPITAERTFILENVLGASSQWQQLAPFADIDAALATQVLGEADKFVAQVIAPLNRVGDEVGAQWRKGAVTMPPGFADAYRQFWQGGWPALAADPAHGGQGLPAVLEAQLYEMLSGANHGFTMAPGLLHGAYDCLRHHGSEWLKAQYLEKIATGEWLATMCLTEPQAGSDLGLVSTRALPQADGSHLISGSKIFISSGENDLADNIVHLVLAREPGAPAGPKGLSLFLVPKFYPDGTRSAVTCEGIEEKMGLHASPTCAMRFDNARGWIVGAPGRGLAAMFVMMNAARLHVALQGLGLLDAAWQKADAYARERRQMRAPGASAASLLIEHPAMRRILDTQRAWIDAGRVLAYQTALELDIARHHPDAARRAQAEHWCALTTPVMKAAFTHQAFHGASDCLQVFGGHGYVRESGIEQHVRDARVTMIYEGTNEIQAIDLLVRKVLADGGQNWCTWLEELAQPLGKTALAALARTHLQALRALTPELVAACHADAALPYEVADDYLRAAAVALLCWAGSRIEATADSCGEPARWHAPLQALQRWIAPELPMRCAIISHRLPAAAP